MRDRRSRSRSCGLTSAFRVQDGCARDEATQEGRRIEAMPSEPIGSRSWTERRRQTHRGHESFGLGSTFPLSGEPIRLSVALLSSWRRRLPHSFPRVDPGRSALAQEEEPGALDPAIDLQTRSVGCNRVEVGSQRRGGRFGVEIAFECAPFADGSHALGEVDTLAG